MSAAFLGPFVEKDIKKIGFLISTVCFACRFAGTGASIAAGCPRRAHLLWRNHGHWIGRRLSDAGEEPNAVVRQRSRHRHRRRGFGLAKAIAGSISVTLTVDAVFNAAGAA